MLEIIILIILLISLFAKWFLLIIICIPIKLYKSKQESNELLSDESTVNTSQSYFVPTVKRYISGYLRYMDFQVGNIPSHHVRDFIYRYLFSVDMKQDSIIYFGAEIRCHNQLHIGKGSIIGDRAILDARKGGIFIGENVNISSNVRMWSEQHNHNDPYFRCIGDKHGPITIENRVWIGPDVTILHSVTIGEGAVVAAGSVVTKDVPPFSIVAGIPAKVIGQRNKNLCYEFNGEYLPFY